MKQRKKQDGITPMAILVGLAMAIAVCILAMTIVSLCVEKEKVGEETAQQTLRLIIWAISALSGSATASHFAGKNQLTVSLLTGGCFYAVLICAGVLLFNGSMTGLWAGTLAIGTCSVIPSVSAMWKPKKKRYAYRR